MKTKRILACLLCVLMLLSLVGCDKKTYGYSPADYLSKINILCSDDFGVLTVKEKINPYTQKIEISEKLHLILHADTVTNTVQKAELVLTIDTETEKLDYSSFSYFFLIMLKAYDEGISVGNINSIHDSLGVETYISGTDTQIGYGSNEYFYAVTESTATFTAQYNTPSAKDTVPY